MPGRFLNSGLAWSARGHVLWPYLQKASEMMLVDECLQNWPSLITLYCTLYCGLLQACCVSPAGFLHLLKCIPNGVWLLAILLLARAAFVVLTRRRRVSSFPLHSSIPDTEPKLNMSALSYTSKAWHQTHPPTESFYASGRLLAELVLNKLWTLLYPLSLHPLSRP